VHTKHFFVIVIRPGARTDKKRQTAKTWQSQNRDSQNFEKSQAPKTKLLQANLGSLHFKELSCSPSQSSTKLQSSCFTFRRFATHSQQECPATNNVFNLNSAPYEATTSIMAESHDDEARSEREH
jgi:hypothetical protein